MENTKQKRILVCPLNWGIGHASRCVPIIRDLQNQGHQVFLAADGAAYDFLKQAFPQLPIEHLPDLNMHYIHPSWKASWAIALQGFRILRNKQREHQLVKALVDKYHIDWIISDNRYGVYHKNTKNTLISHQLFIQVKVFNKLINNTIKKWINAFDECWVPDYEDEKLSLSGALSHGNLSGFNNIQYIGPKSRFSQKLNLPQAYTFEFLALISGVEPHRTRLEQDLQKHLKTISGPCCMVLGKTHQKEIDHDQNIEIYSFADTLTLERLISQSKHIICRSGYSTIMDLHALGRYAILIPTPGQTEQEYLAEYLQKFGFVKQT